MFSLKKESSCFSNCSNNACCNFVNEAISGYFRDANTTLSTAITTIITAFPLPVATADQVAGLAALCAVPNGDNLTAFLQAFGITPNPVIPPGALAEPFISAVSALCVAAAITPLSVGSPIPVNLVGTVSALGQLTTLFNLAAAGTGTTFASIFNTIISERTARIVALKIKFDDINRVLLDAFRQLLCGECKQECCQSAADAIRVIATSFFRLSVATAANTGIPVLPITPMGVAPTPGSLQFLLANYDFELEAAVCVIVSSVICCEEEEEEEECFSCNKPCDTGLKIKPKPKECCPSKAVFEDKKSEKKCEEKWFEDKPEKRFEKKCEEKWVEDKPEKKSEKKCEEKWHEDKFEEKWYEDEKKCEEEKSKYRKKDQKKPEVRKKESSGTNWIYDDNVKW